ncbi:hypothetical protein A2Y85_05155 [candidate division WOR-3 bacterium RBG_13_43_14]|uniref:Uncharacterized protein n=1 Tax=candidate division WOR-3 bacterium RBG_13_43_14 TaxID=1802590 RepID=A0A1F4U8E8_UNCW3|nr:MAG: hypothetical protein A2Y85_05155 [candidate division WOR-3 bacterium RBG_13_43_14]
MTKISENLCDESHRYNNCCVFYIIFRKNKTITKNLAYILILQSHHIHLSIEVKNKTVLANRYSVIGKKLMLDTSGN